MGSTRLRRRAGRRQRRPTQEPHPCPPFAGKREPAGPSDTPPQPAVACPGVTQPHTTRRPQQPRDPYPGVGWRACIAAGAARRLPRSRDAGHSMAPRGPARLSREPHRTRANAGSRRPRLANPSTSPSEAPRRAARPPLPARAATLSLARLRPARQPLCLHSFSPSRYAPSLPRPRPPPEPPAPSPPHSRTKPTPCTGSSPSALPAAGLLREAALSKAPFIPIREAACVARRHGHTKRPEAEAPLITPPHRDREWAGLDVRSCVAVRSVV